jgi:hypothetical protein
MDKKIINSVINAIITIIVTVVATLISNILYKIYTEKQSDMVCYIQKSPKLKQQPDDEYFSLIYKLIIENNGKREIEEIKASIKFKQEAYIETFTYTNAGQKSYWLPIKQEQKKIEESLIAENLNKNEQIEISFLVKTKYPEELILIPIVRAKGISCDKFLFKNENFIISIHKKIIIIQVLIIILLFLYIYRKFWQHKIKSPKQDTKDEILESINCLSKEDRNDIIHQISVQCDDGEEVLNNVLIPSTWG